jgi:hypothetical protein
LQHFQKKRPPALFGAAGSSVAVYYITAGGSKRTTMMENTASADISTTGAWQKLLRRNGSWQVLTMHWIYAFTVFFRLFVAVATYVVFCRGS